MIYYQISALVNAIMALILALFIFIKQRRNPAANAFVILNIAVFIWSAAYFLWQVSSDANSALFWCRVLIFGASFTAPAWVQFVALILGRWKEMKKWVLISYSITIIIVVFIGTPLVVNRVEPLLRFPFWPMAGPLVNLHFLNTIIFPAIGIYFMYREYPYVSNLKKSQIRILIYGVSIGFLSGASNNPQWYGIKIYPIFNGTVWLYTLLMFYAIVRYRILEIDTVIHRTILWILTSCFILIPVGVLLFFIRSWLNNLNWLQLTFLMTGLFYVFLYYYRKTQPRIDHLFRRRKYDYYQVLGEVGQKIGSELDINNVITRLFKELKDILYIRNGLALVQQPGEKDYTDAGNIGYENLPEVCKVEKVVLVEQSPLGRWLQVHQRILEREQVEADPQYASIKEEALSFFNQNSLELLIPVVMEGKVNALIGIGKKENLQAYTLKDIELLENMGRQIGITIDNAMHHEDIVEKERLAEEMKLGREIQMNLLPREIPIIAGLNVQGLMHPAKEIGGDYYDFITVPDKDKLAVVIGDVSGKGVAAGLLMAMAKTAIHTLSQEETSPKEILLRTNTILNKHIGAQKFMTMLYFRYDTITKILTYSAAGHEHILIYRASQNKVESIISGGFMLGMIPDISSFLEDKNITLSLGDKIILYTDGVTEARNPQEDLFGLEKLIEFVEKYGSKPAEQLLNSINEEVYAYIGTREQYDDITLVVMEAT